MNERLLTPKDVADRLQCSTAAARQLMKFKMKHVRVGKLVRVSASVLEAWLARGGSENARYRRQTDAELEHQWPDNKPRASTQATKAQRERARVRERSPLSDEIKARIATSTAKKNSYVSANIQPRSGHGANAKRLVTLPDGTRAWVNARRWRALQRTLRETAVQLPAAAATVAARADVFTVRTPLEAARAGERFGTARRRLDHT